MGKQTLKVESESEKILKSLMEVTQMETTPKGITYLHNAESHSKIINGSYLNGNHSIGRF